MGREVERGEGGVALLATSHRWTEAPGKAFSGSIQERASSKPGLGQPFIGYNEYRVGCLWEALGAVQGLTETRRLGSVGQRHDGAWISLVVSHLKLSPQVSHFMTHLKTLTLNLSLSVWRQHLSTDQGVRVLFHVCGQPSIQGPGLVFVHSMLSSRAQVRKEGCSWWMDGWWGSVR